MKIIRSFISDKLFWFEFALIVLIQLVPRYFVEPNVPEPVFALALNVALWCAYLAANHSYLRRAPKSAWILFVAYVVAASGYLESETLTNLFLPLRDAFLSLAMFGIFSQKYNESKYVRAFSLASILLMPLIIWQSVTRNNIDLLAQVASRHGLNLIGYFSVIFTCFSFIAFNGKLRALTIIPILLVLISASRAALIGVIIISLSYINFSVHIKRGTLIRGLFFLIGCSVVLAILGLFFYQDVAFYFSDISERSMRIVQFSDIDRLDQWSFWLDYMLDSPSFMGNGLATYARKPFIVYYPHNAYLHMLNGGGLLAGMLYIIACISMGCILFKKGRAATVEASVSHALLFFLLLRGMVEADPIGSSDIHIVSLLVAYIVGVGFYRKNVLIRSVPVDKRMGTIYANRNLVKPPSPFRTR
ncbi:MAG: O-antigen ligase family protein [Nitrospirae bacterium]|nr:O-antigen ligase family protein [Nitrospirota bacterium]